MKTKDQETSDIQYLRSTVHMLDQIRHEVRKRTSLEDVELSWRLESLDQIITLVQDNPADFHRLWLQPLLAAGASLETALAFVVESHFQPN